MDSKPALQLDLRQYEQGVNCVIESYVDSEDHGYLIVLLVGSFSLMLIDSDANHSPIKIDNENLAKKVMTEFADVLMSSSADIKFNIEHVASIAHKEIGKVWVSVIVDDKKFLVVNKEDNTFKFLFFNDKEGADLVADDIARNLGGELPGVQPEE